MELEWNNLTIEAYMGSVGPVGAKNKIRDDRGTSKIAAHEDFAIILVRRV